MKKIEVEFFEDGTFVLRGFTDFLGWFYCLYTKGTLLSEVAKLIETASPVQPGRDENDKYVELLANGWTNGYYVR